MHTRGYGNNPYIVNQATAWLVAIKAGAKVFALPELATVIVRNAKSWYRRPTTSYHVAIKQQRKGKICIAMIDHEK